MEIAFFSSRSILIDTRPRAYLSSHQQAVAEDGNDADGLPFPATGVDITATTTTAG